LTIKFTQRMRAEARRQLRNSMGLSAHRAPLIYSSNAHQQI